MTGEITLSGAVLPVGGVKQKVHAAFRRGLTRVVLPDMNRNDIIDLPESVKTAVSFIFVRHIEEAIPHMLMAHVQGGEDNVNVDENKKLNSSLISSKL